MKQLASQLLRTTVGSHDNNAVGDELRRLGDELAGLGGQDVDPSFVLRTAAFSPMSVTLSDLEPLRATSNVFKSIMSTRPSFYRLQLFLPCL